MQRLVCAGEADRSPLRVWRCHTDEEEEEKGNELRLRSAHQGVR